MVIVHRDVVGLYNFVDSYPSTTADADSDHTGVAEPFAEGDCDSEEIESSLT